MRILSRLPVRRAPMAVATVGAPPRSAVDAPAERALPRTTAAGAAEADDKPTPLAPARGIIIALGLGALGWALVAAFLLSR